MFRAEILKYWNKRQVSVGYCGEKLCVWNILHNIPILYVFTKVFKQKMSNFVCQARINVWIHRAMVIVWFGTRMHRHVDRDINYAQCPPCYANSGDAMWRGISHIFIVQNIPYITGIVHTWFLNGQSYFDEKHGDIMLIFSIVVECKMICMWNFPESIRVPRDPFTNMD